MDALQFQGLLADAPCTTVFTTQVAGPVQTRVLAHLVQHKALNGSYIRKLLGPECRPQQLQAVYD